MSHVLGERFAKLGLGMEKRLKVRDRRCRQWLAKYDTVKLNSAVVDATIKESMHIPDAKRRENLFAIVLPAGCGKSTLCRKYGYLDIDECAGGAVEATYYHAITEMMEMDRFNTNATGAKVWLDAVNNTLDKMVFYEPCVVMANDVVTAHLIGATVLCGIAVNDEAVAKGIAHRSKADKGAAKATTDLLLKVRSVSGRAFPVLYADSYEEMESKVLQTLEVNGLTGCMNEVFDDYMARYEEREITMMQAVKSAKACSATVMNTGWNDMIALARQRDSRDRRAISRGSTAKRTELYKLLHLDEHKEVEAWVDTLPGVPSEYVERMVCWWKFIGQDMSCSEGVLTMLAGVTNKDDQIVMPWIDYCVKHRMWAGTPLDANDIEALMILKSCFRQRFMKRVVTRAEAESGEGVWTEAMTEWLKKSGCDGKFVNLAPLRDINAVELKDYQIYKKLCEYDVQWERVDVNWLYYAMHGQMKWWDMVVELDVMCRMCRDDRGLGRFNMLKLGSQEVWRYEPLVNSSKAAIMVKKLPKYMAPNILGAVEFGEVGYDVAKHLVERVTMACEEEYTQRSAIQACLLERWRYVGYALSKGIELPGTCWTYMAYRTGLDDEDELRKWLVGEGRKERTEPLNYVECKARCGEQGFRKGLPHEYRRRETPVTPDWVRIGNDWHRRGGYLNDIG
ncbi:hypothetical protein [Alphachrysovirus cerasi]|uniref:Uncharacterized protein n=1 Tax=Alphachrysovirus cerasi TaxID=284687 RepID=Q65A80_9VIRU|nr:hypothetical protein ACDACVs4_gp01 [Alphachrysovirus cerasi]CAG77599.1 hypothetical protein [Alphachrysovirus cerasi]